MCGIAGCIAPPGRAPDRGALERMATAIHHRGPDDSGIAVCGQTGFVHTRLAIVDPSTAGHQPMRSPGGRLLISYNGEIYNHAELRTQLPPAPYRSGTDTETLLHALETWGEDAIARCNGLWAYAVLDEQAGRVMLVRDRFGVKPLYVARHAGALWFASEIRALLAAGVPRRGRSDVLQHFLRIGWAGGAQTPIEGIDRVRPGSLLAVDLVDLATEERRWYRVEQAVDPALAERLARASHEELVDQVEEALRISVRRRLMSDVPLGTMCSGGLDSSIVTALAAQESAGTFHAFNASLVDRPDEDESAWAQRVAQHTGSELHTAPVDGATWRTTLVDAVFHNEYPLTHESTGPMGEIARVARREGVKVLLSGEGADELFGGYPWRRAAAHRAFDMPALRRVAARMLRRRAPAETLAAPRGPGAASNRFDDDVEEQAFEAYAHHRKPRRTVEAGLLAELSQYLPHLLNRQDKSTMQHSIETREPFLDPELVALAVNLSLERRVRPERKALLRDVALRHIPEEIVRRPKVGFGFDVRGYIEPAARPEFLHAGRLAEMFGLEPAVMAEVAATAQSHGTLLLWTGEIWTRLFLEGASREQVEGALWRTG
jgi:asparagine synthase (glutamine-hydrolysing)